MFSIAEIGGHNRQAKSIINIENKAVTNEAGILKIAIRTLFL